MSNRLHVLNQNYDHSGMLSWMNIYIYSTLTNVQGPRVSCYEKDYNLVCNILEERV